MNWRRMKRYPAFLLMIVSVTSLCLGCAPEADAVKPEDVVLIEPMDVAESFETVQRRNLYEYKIYDGIICPYAEEVKIKREMRIDEYCTVPGEQVKTGQTIISADTEELDEQIDNMRKRMAEDEENYQEYLKENQESLEKLREDEKLWGGAVERWEKEKPEEFLPAESAETDADGASAMQPNPDYAKWAQDMSFYETKYRNALIGRQKLEAAIEQRGELYQLDLEHQQLLLRRLETQRKESNLVAEMSGYVANVNIENRGRRFSAGDLGAVVADPDRKLLKTAFVNNQDIRAAEQVFAMVDGKRYEVEYVPMDNEEYKQLEQKNGKVYATFNLPEELADVELGTYAVVVVIKKSRQDALTVSYKAVSTGEDGSYVYVLRDGERIYTSVRTGMRDGVFVEILSGLEEGDQVLSEEAQPKEGKTQKLVMGSVSHQVSKSAQVAYTRRDTIVNPVTHGNVYLVECDVSQYQQVKKGEVLVKIRVEPDEAELKRLENALSREQERVADLKKQDEEKNAKAITAREKTIANLAKQIAEIKADYATTEIKAPYDGVVVAMAQWQWRDVIGSQLSPNYAFMELSPADSNFLSVLDEEGLFSFGSSVSIEYKDPRSGVKTAEGQVVSLNLRSVNEDMLMKNLTKNWWEYGPDEINALISVPQEAMESFMGSDGYLDRSGFKVTVTTRKMDNVLLIPKGAVLTYSGATYARIKLEDGTVMYQGFVAGGSDSENYWVVEGLTEGMEVCIE